MQISTEQTVTLGGLAPCENELSIFHGETVLTCCQTNTNDADNTIQGFFYDNYIRINELYVDASRKIAYWDSIFVALAPFLLSSGAIAGFAGISKYWNFQDANPSNSYSYQFGYYEAGGAQHIYLAKTSVYANLLTPILPVGGLQVEYSTNIPISNPDLVVNSGTDTITVSSRIKTLPSVPTNPYVIPEAYSCIKKVSGLLPNTLNITGIRLSDGNSNAVPFLAGDLVMIMQNYPNDIDYDLLPNGDLFISTSTNDADKYYIDSNGDLRYNGC